MQNIYAISGYKKSRSHNLYFSNARQASRRIANGSQPRGAFIKDALKLINKYLLKQPTFLPYEEQLIKEIKKQDFGNSDPAYKNAIKILGHFFENVRQEPPAKFIKNIKKISEKGGTPLILRAEFNPKEWQALQFNLLTFNYKVFYENEAGEIKVADTPPEDQLALKTQLYLKFILKTAGYPVQLLLNPDELMPPTLRNNEIKILRKQKWLHGYAGKKELLKTVEKDLRKFNPSKIPYYNREDIGLGIHFQEYGYLLDSELEEKLAQIYKQANPIYRIIYSIGGTLNDIKNLSPDEKSDLKKHFNKFCNGSAIAVYGEGRYLQAGHRLLSTLHAKGSGGKPIIELPAGWNISNEGSEIWLNYNSDPPYRIQIGYRSNDGSYIPRCPILVAMAFGDITANFGATHSIAVFNDHEAKLVNEYVSIAQQVFGIGTETYYLVGGIEKGKDEIKLYKPKVF
jgi:hypothetical protein